MFNTKKDKKIKRLEKAAEISKDQSRDAQENIQKLTDKYIIEVEKHLHQKKLIF